MISKGEQRLMNIAYLSRQVLQTQCQALLQRSAAGVIEDDSIWVDMDAIGIDACAFRLYKSNALLHCAVVLREVEYCCVWSLLNTSQLLEI